MKNGFIVPVQSQIKTLTKKFIECFNSDAVKTGLKLTTTEKNLRINTSDCELICGENLITVLDSESKFSIYFKNRKDHLSFISKFKSQKNIEKIDFDLESGKKNIIYVLFYEKFDLNLKKKKFEQNEVIELEKEELVSENLTAISFESKYLIAARAINNLVGGKDNYDRVYNCITRVRFKIKDKKTVDIEGLKNVKGVKGVVWAGDELQVIVGGESRRIREEIKNLNTNKYENINLDVKSVKKEKFSLVSALNGILIPCLPVLIASGLLLSIQSLLVQFNALPSDTNANIFGFLLFIASITGLSLVGVFFCYTTVKYFGGNPIYGILIGLIITSKLYGFVPATEIPLDGGISLSDINFGQFIADKKYGVTGWFLFPLGDYPVVVRGYEGSILPFVAAGLLIIWMEPQIKKIIPKQLELIFVPFLTVIVVLIPMFFVIGPLLSLLEFGLAQFIFQLEKMPFGIGMILYAMIYQAVVLTGTHNVINMTVNISFLAGTPSMIFAVCGAAFYGQVGACIGVAIMTKNKTFKRNAVGTIVPALVGGITEPMLYGVTLPKVKPFVIGSIAGGFGAIFMCLFDLPVQVPAGGGLFAILGFIGIRNQLLILAIWTATVAFAIIFTMMVYSEKVNVKLHLNMANLYLKMTLKKAGFKVDDYKEVFKELDNVKNNLKENKDDYKKYEKLLIQLKSFDAKMEKINSKEEKEKNKLFKIMNQTFKNKKSTAVEKEKAKDKFVNFDLQKEKDALQNEIDALNAANFEFVEKINLFNEKEINDIKATIAKLEKMTALNLLGIKNKYINSVNSIDIGYDNINKLPEKVSFKHTMTIK